jgi:prolyl-tRNA synthetase
MADKLTPRSQDFSAWYNEIVLRAELADYSPVRGSMVIRPYGYALWENIQSGLDRRFKATGHVNAYFPLFIPMSFLQKEREHVEGFSPELAVVTHAGGEELQEPLVVRPTSETIIGHMYAQWIKSYRDLPILINCWNNVVRWELRTRLFLRTAEFLWQEGHTAHATAAEAEAETIQMLDVYTDFAVSDGAIPVIAGRKSNLEKFAGAVRSYSIEAMMGDKKALQAGTSHFLGQNFARAFDMKYLDRANELKYCWTTSWGLSTRIIGGIIMVHGDDQGLKLPPRLAPIQLVIIPIFKTGDEKSKVMGAIETIKSILGNEVRYKVDDREELSPGFKFNEWELRGVPLRLEVGPKEVEKDQVVLARRDVPGKAGKSSAPQAGLLDRVREALDTIQADMHRTAAAFRDANVHEAHNYDEFKALVEDGFARVWWAGSDADELKVKEETKATLRCIPLDQPGGEGVCFYTGKPAQEIAIFAKAY